MKLKFCHCKISTISRKPREGTRQQCTSSVAAVAYALCTSLKDERQGVTYNYAHGRREKAYSIVDMGIRLPDGSMIIQKERNRLGEYAKFWSEVEKKETRKDSRTARSIILALPKEATRKEQLNILGNFRNFLGNEYGAAVQIAIHYDNPKNPHAHLIFTTRAYGKNRMGYETGEKTRALDSEKSSWKEITKIRKAWADANNRILPKYGFLMSEKSYKKLGIDREPGKHLHPAAWRAYKAETAEIDKKLEELQAELIQLEKERERENGEFFQAKSRTDSGSVQRVEKRTGTNNSSGLQGQYRQPDNPRQIDSIRGIHKESGRSPGQEIRGRSEAPDPAPVFKMGERSKPQEGNQRSKKDTSKLPNRNTNLDKRNNGTFASIDERAGAARKEQNTRGDPREINGSGNETRHTREEADILSQIMKIRDEIETLIEIRDQLTKKELENGENDRQQHNDPESGTARTAPRA